MLSSGYIQPIILHASLTLGFLLGYKGQFVGNDQKLWKSICMNYKLWFTRVPWPIP